MNRRIFDLALLAIATGCALIGACDPVHQANIQKLGGEDPRVRKGPLHRPNQPCLVCHTSAGPGSPAFSVAGTIYQLADVQVDGVWQPQREPAVGVRVLMTDGLGHSFSAHTNEAGNFYLTPVQYDPVYPLMVKLCTGDACDPAAVPPTAMPMKTHIGRDGSCATCHQDPEGPESAGHIYLADPPAPVTP